MKAKILNIQTLLYLALVLALVSSLSHVAFAFATTNGHNWTEAYLSAVAIDVGLLALAAGINRRKAQRRGTIVLWVGVLMFSLISVYANWLAGIVHVVPIQASVTGISAWLVSLRPILLSSVLPVLVIYLSEVSTDNHEYQAKLAEREAKKQAKQRTNEPSVQSIDKAQAARLDRIGQRRQQVKALLSDGMDKPDIAQALDVSVRTVKRDIEAISTNGRGAQ